MGFQDVSAEPGCSRKTQVTPGTAGTRNYVRHRRVRESRCFCEHYARISTLEPVRQAPAHPHGAHTRGRGAERAAQASCLPCPRRRGRGRGGKVPSCPGTGGSNKACTSSGPSRQADWQGALLHSTCQRVIPRARECSAERGAPPGAVTTSMWSPRLPYFS